MSYSVLTKNPAVADWCEDEEIKCKLLINDETEPAELIHYNLWGFKEDYLLYTDFVPEEIELAELCMNNDFSYILVANNQKMKQLFRNALSRKHDIKEIIDFNDSEVKEFIKWI